MRRWIRIGSIVFMLTGCASADTFTPLRGQTEVERKADLDTCKAEADTTVPPQKPVGILTKIACGLTVIDACVEWAGGNRAAAVENAVWPCMKAKSYQAVR
jgi:hypothetical protein